MEYIDFLHTLSEISIGILGFTGMVLALRHQVSKWDKRERVLFETLVSTALTALVGTFIPEILSMVINGSDLIWKYSNLLFLILHITNILIAAARGGTKIKPVFIDYINLVTGIISLLCCLLAFLEVFQLANFIFISAIIQQLYVAIGNFLRLVSYSGSSK